MDKYDKIIARYVNGDASKEEIGDLLEACKENPSLLDKLAEQTKAHRLLNTMPTDFTLNTREIISQIEGNIPDVSEKVVTQLKKEKKSLFFTDFLMAVAALIAISFFIYSVSPAAVTGSLEAGWSFKVNDNLNKGKYSLEEGYTKLTFRSGAVVLVEGPAEFEIIDDMNLFLSSGKVVADVPPSAHGFRIDTPTSNTIDLGTRFAVAADNNGQAEIHVMEGLVKSKSVKEKGYVELRRDEALKVNIEKSVKLEADSGKFLTMLPPEKMNDLKYILWRFDEREGKIANEETFGYDKNFKASLKSDGKNSSLPKWIEGKFGGAVKFNGSNNYVETDFPGIGGSNSRTVCFWLKADTKKVNGYAIITWGSFEKFGATWQISLNPTKTDGPLGRIRCGTHKGQVIGTTDLRDDKWHHVAVVMYGGPKADVSTNILIFIDGKLEQASRKSVRQIDTDIESSKAVSVQMGKNAAANFNPKSIHKFFKGSLDEVYVFNYALTPGEIRKVMNNMYIENLNER